MGEYMEYKVVTMKDRFFAGKFDPEKLEVMLNVYAAEGWSLKEATTANIPGFAGNREEIIFILERSK
jgi:predicted rRNA methylase YqxC with S4 and FtsJ domains